MRRVARDVVPALPQGPGPDAPVRGEVLVAQPVQGEPPLRDAALVPGVLLAQDELQVPDALPGPDVLAQRSDVLVRRSDGLALLPDGQARPDAARYAVAAACQDARPVPALLQDAAGRVAEGPAAAPAEAAADWAGGCPGTKVGMARLLAGCGAMTRTTGT